MNKFNNNLNENIMDYDVMDQNVQESMLPSDAYKALKLGNERFLRNEAINRDYFMQINATAEGQYPHSIILSCIDSRIPTEIIFDQGIGDLFNVRIAGNFVNADILGSIEFACKIAGAKLIVIMGHTSCGAIKGACDDAELGNLTFLLDRLKPAVDLTYAPPTEKRTSQNKKFVDRVAETNVHENIKRLKKLSPVINEMYINGEVDIKGAMYKVETGEVVFFDE